MTKLPISVCIIAGNEAQRIRRTLESVAGWTSEIIVVLNADVSDGTDKIAAEFGAKVFREPWKGYVAQKNSAAEKCHEAWLLNLDADEVASPQLQREIAAATTATVPIAAYEFSRCTFYCGRWIRHGDWYPDRVRRLWLRSNLLHYSNENIARHIAKISPYQVEFVKRRMAAGKAAGFFELAVRPPWRFVRAYFLRLGFLDGWQGFYIAGLSAFSTLTKYAMVCEAVQEQEQTSPK
jgi:glycosyltransferase involved in cell wall biosynthesis